LLAAYRIGPRGDRRFEKEDIAQFLHHNRTSVNSSNTT
jgi:hypothetical protein